MASRKVTGLVNAEVGHDGIDAKQINPRSGLHRNAWQTANLVFDTTTAKQYGPLCPNNAVEIQKATLHVTETQVSGAAHTTVLQLGTPADADAFGSYVVSGLTTSGSVAAGSVVDLTDSLLGTATRLAANTPLVLTPGSVTSGTIAGQGVVHVEYVILDNV